MNSTPTATAPTVEASYFNLCRFTDLVGFSFGYAGGARRASELIEANRSLLTFDACGNLTGTTDRAALVKSVTASVLAS